MDHHLFSNRTRRQKANAEAFVHSRHATKQTTTSVSTPETVPPRNNTDALNNNNNNNGDEYGLSTISNNIEESSVPSWEHEHDQQNKSDANGRIRNVDIMNSESNLLKKN